MVGPPVKQVRIVRAGAGVDGAALGAAVGRPEWAGLAHPLKRDGRTAVFHGPVPVSGGTEQVVVKCLRLDSARVRLGALVGRTRLSRQWRGAERLARAGIETARPLVLARGVDAAGERVEALILEWSAGTTLLHAASQSVHATSCGGARCDVRGEHELADEAGRLVGRLVRAGIFNRDHKASNVIVRREDERPVLMLIDPVGIRGRRAGGETVMLAKLAIECMGVGMLPRRGLLMRAVIGCARELGRDRAWRRRTWRVVEYVIGGHGDPRPKDDPLAAG